ncbi:MAG: Ig-like domain-containing protein, partial [Phycisphaerae bacterium]|nr:Ig-like domain-containing protein [Phycisphaerae bacterium]
MKKLHVAALAILLSFLSACMSGGMYNNAKKQSLFGLFNLSDLFNNYAGSMQSALPPVTNAPVITITLTFDETVTGIAIADINVTNGTVTNLTGTGTTYTIEVTPLANGTVVVEVVTGAGLDPQGNPTGPVKPFSIVSDTSVDLTTVSIASNNADPTRARTGNRVTVSFTAGEDILAPTATINGIAAAIAGGPVNWTASYVMTDSDVEGDVTFAISGIQDLAGNTRADVSATTDSSAVAFDRTAPGLTPVSIASTNADPTLARANDTITLLFTSLENITAPSVSIMGQGATIGGGPTDWTATYVATGSDDEGTVAFAISGIRDLAGNAAADMNATTDGTSVTFDRTAPGFSGIAPASNSVASDYNVAYTLSEACASGSIVWTETGGVDDPAGTPALHSSALSGTDLSIGAHNITLGLSLNNGSIYGVE